MKKVTVLALSANQKLIVVDDNNYYIEAKL
jgi:hypothetical protein